MSKTKRLSIDPSQGWLFSAYCIAAAFITYSSMYAFRKPFTAGIFEDLELWGIDYKIILITTQVLGYMLSKFIGIKVVPEMRPARRVGAILLMMAIAWIALLLFGITPYPYNFIWLFMNGLPLGMIWGLVFSFLEGRRNTELLGAGMSVSFIVASGLVKAVGKTLVQNFGVSEFWMPFLVGLIFVIPLLIGVWMLYQIPAPTAEDEALRTKRVPMNGKERMQFFKTFATGIILTTAIFMALTVFRDVRDNFAVEIWNGLGYADTPQVLLTAEVPIGISVFVIIAIMIVIKNNYKAFFTNLFMVLLGGVILIVTTYLFQAGVIHPALWMILVGFGMYLSYVSFHTMLYERWIALFRYQSNYGFLMYVADAFGYMASVGILFYKNFASPNLNWLNFILSISYIIGAITIILSLFSGLYFWRKLKKTEATH